MKAYAFACVATLATWFAAGCASRDAVSMTSRRAAHTSAAASAESRPRLFKGMGNHTRQVSTSSERAQQFFNQGLIWTFAFNHDEAIRSFEEAGRLDPGCAMAWWGIANCCGPHINNPVVPPERNAMAVAALQKASGNLDRLTVVERAMIEAQQKRFADPPPADRAALDRAYADEMRQVWHANRSDADIGCLFAEAMMDLRPWDLWTPDGEPQPGTAEIVGTLDEVLRLDPNHPGALHLYIHAMEASPHPERAKEVANRLRSLVPASGHLVHMPSHIDVLTGEWKLASDQNERSIRIDSDYRKLSPNQGFYRLYMGHNHHMLAFAAMMEGRREVALKSARDMVQGVPLDFGKQSAAIVDPFMCAPYDVLKRFGMWDEMLAEPAPHDYWPITTAMWRFSRGVSYAARGDVANAEKERAEFARAVQNVPPDALMMINKAHDTLAIAGHVLDGEIAYRRGDTEEAVRHLRLAVEGENRLRYMEPPEWIQPVRHTLGALLLDAGRYTEAEQVYREDLKNWPENGWSLRGLADSLRRQGRASEADEVQGRFEKAWARADTRISTSCLCVQPKNNERS